MESCKYDDCNQEGTIVICYQPLFVRSCEQHYNELYKLFIKSKRKVNINLGQSIHNYVKPDGSRGRLTVGKDIEISQRTISPDDGKIFLIHN